MFINPGFPYRADWVSKPRRGQLRKMDLNHFYMDVKKRPNKFPRGKCAARMQYLGWEFKDE